MSFLKVSEIHKTVGENKIIKGLSFSQKEFQKIAIAGETGSGKSSLLKIIAGLMQTDLGEVLFEGEKVEGPEEKLVPGHEGIAYLSQHFELPKFLTVAQVLTYANSISEAEAEQIYQICQVDHLLQRKTDQLSGGERQRISLARLLTSGPRLLLLDEPYSNLDIIHKNILKSVIREVSKALDISCILISHDPADTLSWADQILVLRAGKLVQKGSPEKIYHEPINEYVAGLFGQYNVISNHLTASLNGLKTPGSNSGKTIIRPEDFQINQVGEGGIEGTVGEIRYFGSYYQAEVTAAGHNLIVNLPNSGYQPGEKVSLSLVYKENS